MNYEENRLRTFVNWPGNSTVDCTHIARAGFFCTGNGLEVQCFCCGGKITEWKYGEQVTVKHRRLDPRCPFVINAASSGNVPIRSQQQAPAAEMSFNEDMSQVENRVRTFADWPIAHIISPIRLAEAGFYYLHEGDKVQCFDCAGIVLQWEAGDDAVNEHIRCFPNCNFIRSLVTRTEANTEPSDLSDNERLISLRNFSELGISVHTGPHQSCFATYESRLRSFVGWPTDLNQTPEQLAEAGFYYSGLNDQVKCFHCNGGLRRWDPHDEPWTEHGKWFPKCGFLYLVKGPEFVRGCSSTTPDGNVRSVVVKPSTGSIPFSKQYHINEESLLAYMISPNVLTALGIGLQYSRVKQAVKRRFEQTGWPFASVDELIEAVMNLQLDEEAESSLSGESEHVDSGRNQWSYSRVLQTGPADAPNSSNEEIPVTTETPDGSVERLNEVEAPNQPSIDDSPTTSVKLIQHDLRISLEEENRRLKEARMCKICLDAEVGVVFLPCGHLATCLQCAPSLKDCPVCRSVIKANVRTYLV